MSDHAEVLVFNTPEPKQVGVEVLSRLVADGIVQSTVTDCTVDGPGYLKGPSAEKATRYVNQARSLSIRYHEGGALYSSPEGGGWLTCPSCHQRLEDERVSDVPNPLKCHRCLGEWLLGEWTLHGCAFGTVAFFFWDWVLRDGFIDQVHAWANAPLVRIHYHL